MTSGSRSILSAIFATSIPFAAAPVAAKSFMDYFQPTPIISPLTSNAWGCTATGATPANCTQGSGVLPRDTGNGIESPKNPPANYYWDGGVYFVRVKSDIERTVGGIFFKP